MDLALVSSWGIVISAVLYLLAFVAHAWEWGIARGLSFQKAAGEDDEAARIKVDMYGRMGLYITTISVAIHIVAVIARGIAAHRAPWGNMYEFVTSAMAMAGLAYLILAYVFHMRWLGLVMTLLLSLMNGLAATVFFVAIGPLVPALHSVWFIAHIVTGVICAAVFNLGAAVSLLYIIKAKAEAKSSAPLTGYLSKVPSLIKLDIIAYRLHAFAFPVWTFTIAAGAIWAQYAWGRPWGWDPKETWSLITWVVYAIYLHARVTAGWRGIKAAWIALLGVVVFWFNFIGVNLLMSGLHSYAGI